ncbi:MAG: methyl-accepting chemotaxis protein, partial [Treponemataceae bacterium]|nr:methyl-accepting chemotaxis protein [Treponemataceae bacterium]
IRASNETTLAGIKKLGEKISGISDIAFIINSIADQTNIIAFNAEIEASSAGEAGKNFYIVANEIRRLTNSTIESTKDIREKIAEIQQSSEELLETSRSGSLIISEGGKIVDELKSNFEIIQNSSESTDLASEDIRTIIQQQTAAFEQIVVTLRQISAGAESFSETTQTINISAEQLCREASKLENIQPVLVSESKDEK